MMAHTAEWRNFMTIYIWGNASRYENYQRAVELAGDQVQFGGDPEGCVPGAGAGTGCGGAGTDGIFYNAAAPGAGNLPGTADRECVFWRYSVPGYFGTRGL